MKSLENKEPWEMTRKDFVESAEGDFVKYKGGQNLVGLRFGNTIYPLMKGEQSRGRFLVNPEIIRARIHEQEVRGQCDLCRRGKSPYAPPYERNAKPVPARVLADYPDLREREVPVASPSPLWRQRGLSP